MCNLQLKLCIILFKNTYVFFLFFHNTYMYAYIFIFDGFSVIILKVIKINFKN